MTLLDRISRSWLIFSAIAFIVAGSILFFILSILLAKDLDENLTAGENRVAQMIMDGGIIPYQPPFTEVVEIKGDTRAFSIIHDTIVYDLYDCLLYTSPS